MRDLAAKFSRYGLTGGLAALVDAGGFAMLITAGLPIVAAGTISFSVAAGVNYCLTARIVFHRQATPSGFVTFFLAALGGLIINVGVTLGLAATLAVPPLAAKIMGIGVAFLFNFAINLQIVFREKA